MKNVHHFQFFDNDEIRNVLQITKNTACGDYTHLTLYMGHVRYLQINVIKVQTCGTLCQYFTICVISDKNE